jgi:hypothetical protein
MSRNWKIPLEGDPELTTLLTHAPLARTNIVLESQFDDTNDKWIEDNTILTPNAAIAPDGTLTAGLIEDDELGGTATLSVFQNPVVITTGTAWCYSVYFKRHPDSPINGLRIGGFNLTDGCTASYDVETGIVADINSTASGMTYVGNGWYRFWCSRTQGAGPDVNGTFNIQLALAGSISSRPRDGTSKCYIWGAQCEIGSEPTPLIPTTTAARTINSRTNLCLQSEDLSTTWTNFQSIDTQAQGIAPDGTNTANKLVDDSGGGSGDCPIQQLLTISTATEYTLSAYLKADQLTQSQLAFGNNGALSIAAYFDLAAGTTLSTHNDVTSSFIVDVGNGWYRCGLVFTSDAVDTNGYFQIRTNETDGAGAVTRDGTSSILIWGTQLETGATATNYIPTTTAAVTVTGYSPRGSLVDDMHQALETVLEVEGNINDLWKRYKQLN